MCCNSLWYSGISLCHTKGSLFPHFLNAMACGVTVVCPSSRWNDTHWAQLWTRNENGSPRWHNLLYPIILNSWYNTLGYINASVYQIWSLKHVTDLKACHIDLMMTSSNGNIFRVTGHLWGEFTSPQWIPCTKASDPTLTCYLWSAPE